MVFTTEGFLEVAVESWPEWDLNPRPLNSVQTLQPTELSSHEFNSLSEPTLYSHVSCLCSVFTYIYIRKLYIYIRKYCIYKKIHVYIYKKTMG